MLFLAYPRSDYDEPDGALASYVEVLSGYSDAIVQHVTSNKTGVQRRSKFPPRVAELVAACDEAAHAIERRKRYENWGRNETLMIDGPKADKPTLAELKAKYGDNWGIDPCGGEPPVSTGFFDKKIPGWDEIAKNYSADPSRIAALTNRGAEPNG